MARTYYYPTVGVKGADADVEALRLFLDASLEDGNPADAISGFLVKNGIIENPLKAGEREFSLENEDDEGTTDPKDFIAALAETFPQLDFFCWAPANNQNGMGVEYRVFKNGKKVKGDIIFFDEDAVQACIQVMADASIREIKAEYALWRIEDSGDAKALADAKKAAQEALYERGELYDFLLDGGIEECLDTDSNTLTVRKEDAFKALPLLENEGGYDGYSLTQIETIDFSVSDDPEAWEELPDLRGYTGLKTLNLTGCYNITELPPYITEKIEAGTLEVIGFPSEKGEDKDDESEEDDENDDYEDEDEDAIEINSEEDALAFAREDASQFEQIPEAYRTREVCLLAVKSNASVCAYVPEELQSEAFFLESVRVNENGKALKYVPVEYLTAAVIREALQAHPGALSANELNLIGAKTGEAENYDAAIFVLNKAVKLNPEDAELWGNLGLAFYNKGDYDSAIEAYRKVVAIDPENVKAWANLGDTFFFEKGDYDGAIEAYRKYIAINPEKIQVWYNLVAALRQKGDYDGAIEACRKAIAIDPKNAETYNSLAYAYLGKKDYAAAVDAVSKAIELEPENSGIWDTRAEIHEAAGEYAEAAADARKALELNPDEESSQQILERCEAKLK